MRPEFIVMAVYWAFGIWIYSIGLKGKRGELKTNGAHVITVFPSKKTDMEQYGIAYEAFHKTIMLLSLVMGGDLRNRRKSLTYHFFSSLAFFLHS